MDFRDYKIHKIQNVSNNCFICGINSAASLKGRFFEIEYGGRPALVGVPAVEWFHQSYPNRMHGGVIGALLDETIGRAAQIADESLWGVTGELKVRYLRPVPLDKQIYVFGSITKSGGLMFEGDGKIILGETGETLATAAGRYVKLPIEKICDGSFHEHWFKDPREKIGKIRLPVNE